MPIRRAQKKRNAEPRQKQNHRRLVTDPMVNPGSSAHRHQARSKADKTRPHHRMVTLAQSSPGDRSACAPQGKTATVMVGVEPLGPINEPTEAIAGSCSTVSTTACWRSDIAGKEISWEASVMPKMNPVSCCGKNPFGMMA